MVGILGGSLIIGLFYPYFPVQADLQMN
jgi:hypothetical protein